MTKMEGLPRPGGSHYLFLFLAIAHDGREPFARFALINKVWLHVHPLSCLNGSVARVWPACRNAPEYGFCRISIGAGCACADGRTTKAAGTANPQTLAPHRGRFLRTVGAP